MPSCQESFELQAQAHALAVLPLLTSMDVATLEHCSAEFLVSNDPEVGHQLRVALRRLRALLWAYQALLPEGLAKHWRQRLGDMGAKIGAARNLDVIVDALLPAAVPPTHPSALILLEALDGVRHKARQECRNTFAVAEPSQLISAFTVALDEVASAQPDKPETVGEFARARVETASRRLHKQLGRAMDGSLTELHQTRIQIKRLRYLLEYFSPVLTKADRKRIRRLTELQDALGELNDVVVGVGYMPNSQRTPSMHQRRSSSCDGYLRKRRPGGTKPSSPFGNWCGRFEPRPKAAKLFANGPTAVNRSAPPFASASVAPNQAH